MSDNLDINVLNKQTLDQVRKSVSLSCRDKMLNDGLIKRRKQNRRRKKSNGIKEIPIIDLQ